MAKIKRYTTLEVKTLVGIGFCQPKFYKASVWRKAKKLMDEVLCPNQLAEPFDFGRGKGKYKSIKDIKDCVKATTEILKREGMLELHDNQFVIIDSKGKTSSEYSSTLDADTLRIAKTVEQSLNSEADVDVEVFDADTAELPEGLKWVPLDEYICFSHVYKLY